MGGCIVWLVFALGIFQDYLSKNLENKPQANKHRSKSKKMKNIKSPAIGKFLLPNELSGTILGV